MESKSDGGATPRKIANSSKRGERGTGTTISVDLKENPELLAKIREAAKGGPASPPTDPSKWLRWRVLALHADGKLFPAE